MPRNALPWANDERYNRCNVVRLLAWLRLSTVVDWASHRAAAGGLSEKWLAVAAHSSVVVNKQETMNKSGNSPQ